MAFDYSWFTDKQLADYAEVDAMLNDINYEETFLAQPQPQEDLHSNPWWILGPDLVLSFAFAFSTLLAQVSCEGILCYAYTAKAVCMGLACILRSTTFFSVYYHKTHFYGDLSKWTDPHSKSTHYGTKPGHFRHQKFPFPRA